MDEVIELLKLLEDLRHKMHETATKKGISDPDVLAISQLLDALHNKYLALVKSNNTKQGREIAGVNKHEKIL